MYYIRKHDIETYTLYCPSDEINCHILVSNGFIPRKVSLNGKEIPFRTISDGNSTYIDFDIIYDSGAKRNYENYPEQKKTIIEIF